MPLTAAPPPPPPPLVAPDRRTVPAPDPPPAIMVPNLPPSWRRAVRPALRRAPAPARVLVFASEFRLSPSRRVVPAGRVWIQVSNIGEDDHDLAVRRADGRLVAITPVIRPGRVATLKMRLSPGRYTLVCTVAGHEGHGMTAPLTVRRRARAGA